MARIFRGAVFFAGVGIGLTMNSATKANELFVYAAKEVTSPPAQNDNLAPVPFFAKEAMNTRTIHEIVAAAQANPISKSTEEIFQVAQDTTVIVRTKNYDGSGWFINNKGDLLTADHVITEAVPRSKPQHAAAKKKAAIKPSFIKVKLGNNNEYVAKISYRDPKLDIAVLHIDQSDTKCMDFADYDQLKVGTSIYQYGNAQGLGLAANMGIVAATERRIDDDPITYMQYSAPTNHGNSGGPVMNGAARAIGMSDAIIDNPTIALAVRSKEITARLMKFNPAILADARCE